MSHIDLHQKQFAQREAQQRIIAARVIRLQQQISNATNEIRKQRERVAELEKQKRELMNTLRRGIAEYDEAIFQD